MVKQLATTLVILETIVVILLTMLLLTPKEHVAIISELLNLKYKIVLIER
jgi:hypothetical protein